MSNAPNVAPPAYPQYAAGAPTAPTHTPSYPAQAAPAPANQGQAWQLLSQAATAMAAAAGAPGTAGAPAAPAVQALQPVAQVPGNVATQVSPAPAPGPAIGGIRMTGPWLVGQLYGVVPMGPLAPIADTGNKWFAITKGRYVGVTNSVAIADGAVTGVSNSLRNGYTTQTEALAAFNQALILNIGLVAVLN